MFNEDEINILMKALDAWETDELGTSLMQGVMGMLLVGKDKKAEAEQSFEENAERARKNITLRKEQAIPIKAKLLIMRDKVLAAEAGKFMEQGE